MVRMHHIRSISHCLGQVDVFEHCGNSSAAGENWDWTIGMLFDYCGVYRTHRQFLMHGLVSNYMRSHAVRWYTLKFGCIQMEPLAILSFLHMSILSFSFRYKHFVCFCCRLICWKFMERVWPCQKICGEKCQISSLITQYCVETNERRNWAQKIGI